jgi:hypothetical protein
MNTKDELQAMTANLQDYLLDGELYKTVTVKHATGEDLIKMTIGGMLDRIATLEENGETRDVVAAAKEAIAREQRSQPEAFWSLVAREAKSNADSWSWYLQRVEEGDEQAIRDYRFETGIRTRLERLLDLDNEQPTLNEARRRTATLDEKLQAMWQGSTYSDYWWEHGSPRAPHHD